MHRLFWSLITAIFMLLLFNDKAHAYIDPGIGGMFYQIIILIFGVVVAYLAVFKRYVKSFLSKRKGADEEDK